jgi:hypothetical protein
VLLVAVLLLASYCCSCGAATGPKQTSPTRRLLQHDQSGACRVCASCAMILTSCHSGCGVPLTSALTSDSFAPPQANATRGRRRADSTTVASGQPCAPPCLTPNTPLVAVLRLAGGAAPRRSLQSTQVVSELGSFVGVMGVAAANGSADASVCASIYQQADVRPLREQ